MTVRKAGDRRGAVVTGAGRGLGKEIARHLVAEGYTVLVTDVAPELVAQAAADLGAEGLVLDVRDAERADAVAARAVELAGRLDVWINNAGVLVTGPAWEQDAATRRLMVEVNTIGLMNGTVSAIRAMKDAGGGHIVNVVSLAGLVAVPGEGVYAGSKHGALGFSLSTQADLNLAGHDDINISCVCPDGIWTPMLHDKLDDPEAALSFSGKLLKPAEVVEAVARVLRKPRQVTPVPRWRGPQVRLADALPDVSLKALPLMVGLGRRQQAKFRRNGVPE